MEIYSVIKNEVLDYIQDGSVIFWKHPNENFHTGSTLIVNESEEALFFRDGVYIDTIPSGRHVLTTQNSPIVSPIRRIMTGGKDIFTSKICFVDKADHCNIPWRVDSGFSVLDSWSNTPATVRMEGTYTFRIIDTILFAKKQLGSNIDIFLENDIYDRFTKRIMMYVQDTVAKTIEASGRLAEVITTKAIQLSQAIQPYIYRIFEDYGIEICDFCISHINIENDENRQKFITELTDKKIREIRDVSYIQERGLGILDTYVMNPGNGAMGTGIGGIAGQLAVGASAAPIISSIVQNVFAPIKSDLNLDQSSQENVKPKRFPIADGVSNERRVCFNCKNEVSQTAKFCEYCGNKLIFICPNCGEENQTGMNFCGRCGKKL